MIHRSFLTGYIPSYIEIVDSAITNLNTFPHEGCDRVCPLKIYLLLTEMHPAFLGSGCSMARESFGPF